MEDLFMLRTLTFTIGLCCSMSALAAPAYRVINSEAIMQDVTVEPTNGGFNPSFSAYIVKARVELGGNSCQAQGLQASLKLKNQGQNQKHIVAYVKGRVRSDLMCPMIYQPVFADVSITVRGEGSFSESIFIRNVERFGSLKPLNSFLNDASQCDELTFCTREYRPTVCVFNGVEIKGTNLCEARKAVKKYACLNSLEYLPEELVCTFEVPVQPTN